MPATLESRAALSKRQEKDAELELAENDRIDRDLPFGAREPIENPGARVWLRRLAQHIRVDQVGHRVSVDSDSTGTK